MGTVGKVLSTAIKGGKRFVKMLLLGKDDTQEVHNLDSWGVDSHAIKDSACVVLNTGVRGQSVVVGYVNIEQIAEVGERRTFSTDKDGNLKFYIHQKNDGTCEIGGDTDNMVRYSELKTAFDELKADFNNLVAAYNSHIHITTATVAATPTPGIISPTTSTGTPSTADVSGAKIDEIKTL